MAGGVSFVLFRWAKTAENWTDYSVMNTVKQMLWLPTTRTEKYNAKQAIDTFFVRGGDLLSSAVVFLGIHVLSLERSGFGLVNFGLTFAWIGVGPAPPSTLPKLHIFADRNERYLLPGSRQTHRGLRDRAKETSGPNLKWSLPVCQGRELYERGRGKLR